MKTISLRKKVSAVAVASLGFGLLSAVPVTASTTNQGNLTVTNSATTITDGTTTNSKLVVYNAGTPITQTLAVASATAQALAGDWAQVTVAVTGPTLASPAGTSGAISSSVTVGSAIAGYTLSSPSANVLRAAYASGTGVNTALTLGTVTFTPTIAGVYTITATPDASATTGTKTAVAQSISVGGNSVLVPTVGTSITTTNAAVGQTGGLTTYRFQPAGFTKTASTVTTYFATVDAGTIESVANSSAAGTGAAATPTNAFTNGTNNAAGFRLIMTTGATNPWNDGGTVGTGVAPAFWDITLNSGTATSQTLTIRQLNAATGAVTLVATAISTYGAAPALSVANSTEVLNAGAGTTASGSDTTATVVSSTASGQQFNIVVTTRDQYNAILPTQTVSATITGSGLIAAAAGTGGGAGNARAASAISNSSGVMAIGVNADGTSGRGVITISVGSTVLATKTVTFYGAVTALTAKQNHTIASTAGAALGDGSATPAATTIGTTAAVIISAKDANGNAVPGLTITARSSDTTVMSETITVNQDSVTTGDYNVQVNSVANTSGKTATLTFRVMSGTTVLASTPALTYTLGGAVSTVALSLDKSTYAQGSAAVATLTLKDSAGNPVFDGDHANILTAALSTSMSVVKALQFSTTATSAASLGGTSRVSFNAPASATAVWTISGTTGTGPSVAAEKGKALSATASVTDASAAITTAIAALNARVVALNALIAKIMKRLNIR